MGWLLEPTSPTAAPLWVGNRTQRTTTELVTSCVLTLGACVWTAIHMDVYPPGIRGGSWIHRLWRRMLWMLAALFVPELILWIAGVQFMEARNFCITLDGELRGKSIKESATTADAEAGGENTYMLAMTDKAPTPTPKRLWRRVIPKDMEVGFFVVMGGYELVEPATAFQAKKYMGALTADAVIALASNGLLELVTAEEINDKSKVDPVTKFLVCIQTGWMVAQCIARAVQGLPVTLLEINTVMHVACALLMYSVWVNKPQDVQVPVEVLKTEKLRNFFSGQWENSSSPRSRVGNQGKHYTKHSHVGLNFSYFLDFDDYNISKIFFVLGAVFLCGIYGGVHLIPWNAHFPTHLERILWRVSGCIVVAMPFFTYLSGESIDWTSGILQSLLLDSSAIIIIPIYFIFRIYLVVEAFASLRSLPERAYDTVSWVEMFPHF